MAYSTILPKMGKCTDCNDGIEKEVIAGRCKLYHYKPYRTKITLEKQKERLKVRGLRSLPANKEMVQSKYKNVQSNELKLWFLDRMHNNMPICENCGATGDYLKEERYSKLWKSCQAHLLPKRFFKSIEAHPLNGLVLGSGFSQLCHCHDTYDHDWDSASKMKIWSTVVERFKILYPLTLPEEHKHIPQILLDTLL